MKLETAAATWTCALLLCCGPGRPQLNVHSPSVVSVDPPDGATGVSLDSLVTLCFDLAMQPATLDASTVSLVRVLGSHRTTLQFAILPSADARCFTVAPLGSLAPLNEYDLSVAKGVLSASGVELAHGTGQTTSFRSAFRTREAKARATLLVPAEGTIDAPLDLAAIRLSFSEPLTSLGRAFEVEPGALEGLLTPDGLGAVAPLTAPGVAGQSVALNLDSSLRDATGGAPEILAPLGFTYGACAEAGAPSLGAGLALGRDRDAVVLFLVDRPSLCDAAVTDPACPDGGALAAPAVCDQAYDPCMPSGSCQCLVPLVGLCPGNSISVVPSAHGWNGRTASTESLALTLWPALPTVAIGELMLSPPAGKRAQIYVEVQNVGTGPIDLKGLVLADCRGTVDCFAPAHEQAFGAFAAGGATVLPSHGYALLVDGTFDATLYPGLPAGTLLLSPSDRSPLMHLASNQPQPIGLVDAASGALLSSFDGSLLPVEGVAIERIDPRAPDPQPASWGLGTAPGGTPGSCNSITQEADCLESLEDGG
jgi:Bacterial Ig-like domain